MRGNNHKLAALVLAALALASSACGGSDSSPDGGAATDTRATSAAPAANEVVIRLIAFKPESLSVPAGTEVTWKQMDASSHTVTSGTVTQGAGDVTTAPDGKFDSANLARDAIFRFTFDEAGTFPYFCSLHPATMRGEVRVS